jgi:hypothetical protein
VANVKPVRQFCYQCERCQQTYDLSVVNVLHIAYCARCGGQLLLAVVGDDGTPTVLRSPMGQVVARDVLDALLSGPARGAPPGDATPVAN